MFLLALLREPLMFRLAAVSTFFGPMVFFAVFFHRAPNPGDIIIGLMCFAMFTMVDPARGGDRSL